MLFNNTPLNEELINGELATPAGATDTITFNGFGLQNSKVITSEADENGAPQRELTLADIAGDDGQTIEFDRLSQKIIKLSGLVLGDTAEDLDARIDEMKKNILIQGGILKITQIGGKVRYYTATAINIQSMFSGRTGRDVTRAPFEIEFLCVDPFAREVAREVVSYFSQTIAAFSFELFNDGNYKTPPILILSFDAATSVTKVNITNNTTGEEIEITEAIAANSILEINAEEKFIQLNGVEKDFDGFFWKLATGANSITITVTSTSHSYNFTGKFFNRYT